MKDFIGGFTALHYAAMHGRARIARLMLESEYRSDIINAKSNDGWTPLHVAAHYGRDSFVRLLLEFKAEVDPLSDKGTTPLQLAIIRERSSCVRILLDHNANIDIQNGFLLRYAVIKGNHSYCRMFLQRGADTNLGRLEDGQTPLHLSALRDDVLCAQMLYTYGADTNTRNYEGQTPVAVSVSMSGISRPCLDFLQEVTSRFFFLTKSLMWTVRILPNYLVDGNSNYIVIVTIVKMFGTLIREGHSILGDSTLLKSSSATNSPNFQVRFS